jgi:hypothetical protein
MNRLGEGRTCKDKRAAEPHLDDTQIHLSLMTKAVRYVVACVALVGFLSRLTMGAFQRAIRQDEAEVMADGIMHCTTTSGLVFATHCYLRDR